MGVLALTAKALVAAVLLVSGGAKAADLASFGTAARLLLPSRVPAAAARAVAAAVAVAELALGAASLSSPAAGWLNPGVFALACGFAGVSGFGYARHRGRACHCFGALPGGRFDARGVARSTAVAVAAGLAAGGPLPAVAEVTAVQRVLLLLAGAVVALGAFSGARAWRLAHKLGLEDS